MIYKYDKDTLRFNKVTNYIVGTIVGVLLFGVICTALIIHQTNTTRFLSEETKAIILNEATKEREFSPQKLKAYILELNIRFPHIVYAQACVESGHFKSTIFKTNNNLFGMKVATKRPTTNKGEENGHAYYESWRESVVDYAFYQAQYLSDIKTEKEYLEYLSASYAEDSSYIEKIKKTIKENKK